MLGEGDLLRRVDSEAVASIRREPGGGVLDCLGPVGSGGHCDQGAGSSRQGSVPWRYLPHDFPPHPSVYGYFVLWEADGIFDQLTGLLRGKVRQAEGRSNEPSACLIDSQSIKTSATVHLASQGIDPAKKIIGRKRHIATDTLGLLLAVTVTAASIHDSAAGTHLLTRVRERHPTITKAWADNGYKTKAVEHTAQIGIAWKSSNAIPPSAASASNPATGSSNAPSAGSCTTAAWLATTKPTPTDQPP